LSKIKGKTIGTARGRPGASRPASAPRALLLSYLRGEKKKAEDRRKSTWQAQVWRGALGVGALAMMVWIAGIGDEAGKAANGVIVKSARAVGVNLAEIHAYGLKHASPDDIAAALMIESGESLLRFNPQKARERLMALAWVRDAEVRRLLPNRIVLTIAEREPFVIHRRDGQSILVDPAAVEIVPIVPSDFPGLLIVEGEGAPKAAHELVEMMAKRPRLRERFAVFRYIEGRRWDGVSRDGLIVQFPQNDLERGMNRLDQIQSQDGMLEQPLAVIDLRNENVVVRPRTTQETGRGA
jgi:cell division protein FtsQ